MSFWTDTKVVDEFTPEDKYFYLYLFTNPHTNLCGCYEISITQMSTELGYSKDTIGRLIERFEKIHKVALYQASTKEILLINWHKYNWTESDKLRVALLKEIDAIKCADFKEYLTDIFNKEDTVSIPYPYPMDTSVTDSLLNINNNNTEDFKELPIEKPIRNIIPPTLSMIKTYCKVRENKVDPEEFFNFYESKGWLVGKTKMKDWQAAVRTWESYKKPKKETKPLTDKQIDSQAKGYQNGSNADFLKMLEEESRKGKQ